MRRCVEFGIGEGVAAGWLGKYGELHLSEKLSILDEKLQSGAITKNIGGYLFRLVSNPQNPTEKIIAAEEQKKLKARNTKREVQQAEWEESEKRMAEQRRQREESRQAVQIYLQSLSKDALHSQKLAFSEEL